MSNEWAVVAGGDRYDRNCDNHDVVRARASGFSDLPDTVIKGVASGPST